MKSTHLIVFLLLLAFAGCATVIPQELALETTALSQKITAVTNVTVITMDNQKIFENYTVIITNDRITTMGADITVPDEAVIIDGTGKFLMPGLIDMHAHFYEETDLLVFLANGITTLRNPGGAPFHLEYKKKMAAGELVGPETFIANLPLDGSPSFWPFNIAIDSPEKADEAVRLIHKAGFDFVKVYTLLNPREYVQVLETAEELGMKVIGHVPKLIGTKRAIQSGQLTIEHINDLPELNFPQAAEYNTWFCPTLWINKTMDLAREDYQSMVDRQKGDYFHPYWEAKYVPYFAEALAYDDSDITYRIFDHLDGYLRKAVDANVSIILGSDSTMPFTEPGFSIHEELVMFVDQGLSPYEALEAGTVNGAKSLEIIDYTGPLCQHKKSRNFSLIFCNTIVFSVA